MIKDEGDDSILEEAYRLTHGERNTDYGHPLDDYTRTSALWNALLAHKLKEPLTPEDTALAMCCVKMSRHVHAPKRDNMTDLAGYAWVVQACTEERARRELASAVNQPVELPEVVLTPGDAHDLEPWGIRDGELAARIVGRLRLGCGCYGVCKILHAPSVADVEQSMYAAERSTVNVGVDAPAIYSDQAPVPAGTMDGKPSNPKSYTRYLDSSPREIPVDLPG